MSNISIKGLNKAAVLAALFNASKQQGMGFADKRGTVPMSLEEAEVAFKNHCEERSPYQVENNIIHFDYLFGRVLKVHLGGDEFDPFLFDRDNGDGAALRALEPLLTATAG